MAKLWNTKNKRLVTAIAVGITGYHALTMSITQLPKLPSFIESAMYGGFSLLTVAGALALYGVYMLLTEEI